MTVSTNLLFSKFHPQEFEQLCQLLCSVFETSPKELEKLYQDINDTFDQPGYPLHFVCRDFFKSASEAFRHTANKSPVIAVDLPSLMELDNVHLMACIVKIRVRYYPVQNSTLKWFLFCSLFW